MKSAYCNLANALVEVDKIDKKDLDFLVQGKQHFPEEPVILIGVINILRKHGMKEGAAKVMEKVLSQPDKLGAEQLKHLREMKSSWDVEQTTRQAADLMEQEDYKGAVALLDALNSRAPLLQARGFIIQQRNQALAFATLQDADRARDEGRKGEAVQLYERIMAMRSVPPYVQGRAEQELRKLKGADSTATDSSGDPGEK